MKSIRNIIAENIYDLRKKNKLTQQDLANKINYSDKAVSRWEKGEVTPDIETLQSLAYVFNVSLIYLLEEHSDDVVTPRILKQQITNRLAFMFFSILTVWLFATITFVYCLLIYDFAFWQIFVWAVPGSCIVGIVSSIIWNKKVVSLICSSIFLWSLITSFFLQFLSLNLWLIFLIGIPLQILIVIIGFMKPIKKKK